ncbi:sigma-54 interaction domain-containing protein [Zoogloea sp.]|uniref:sigma-54 interaction domain-containing protein n=1 Tax=Zoogloea sp. TaxID=49181 RepID=UPI0035B43EE4
MEYSPHIITFPDPRAVSLSIRASAVVFADPKSLQLLSLIDRVAPSNANILIIGETGTGKELVARQVHLSSLRAAQPFLAINCGAFSETLFESELFGFEKGAFTGALSAKAGWFEAANGGTLFLDEIGDLPLPMQVKLLRVLQEGEVVRIGARRPAKVDVRVIAATNVDLEKAVAEGRFREDLYYRLKVVSLDLPILRERPKDILPLARHFISKYAERLDIVEPTLAPQAEKALLDYPWPGNIRELENVLHRALLVFHGHQIEANDLHLPTNQPSFAQIGQSAPAPTGEESFTHYLKSLFEEGHEGIFEHIIDHTLNTAYQWEHLNQVRSARLLGISRNVLRTHLKRMELID